MSYRDLDHFDRMQDARAEAIRPDSNYPALPEDLQLVPGGPPLDPTLGARGLLPARAEEPNTTAARAVQSARAA